MPFEDPNFPCITYRRGGSGQPAAVLRGTGIHVRTVVTAAQRWGMEPRQIGVEYNIPEAQVQEALAFYNAHPREIDRAMADEEELEAAAHS